MTAGLSDAKIKDDKFAGAIAETVIGMLLSPKPAATKAEWTESIGLPVDDVVLVFDTLYREKGGKLESDFEGREDITPDEEEAFDAYARAIDIFVWGLAIGQKMPSTGTVTHPPLATGASVFDLFEQNVAGDPDSEVAAEIRNAVNTNEKGGVDGWETRHGIDLEEDIFPIATERALKMHQEGDDPEQSFVLIWFDGFAAGLTMAVDAE